MIGQPNVRRAIESHLLDSSPAVRDAAVELIGKYMIDSPEVAGDYYQKIADRIAVGPSKESKILSHPESRIPASASESVSSNFSNHSMASRGITIAVSISPQDSSYGCWMKTTLSKTSLSRPSKTSGSKTQSPYHRP
jgi:HEAT repeat associated with sister chromatid cohesion